MIGIEVFYLFEKLIDDIESKCDKNEIPVGAIVINRNFEIVSECFNNRQGSCNVIGHAEILAIQEAEKAIGDWRLDGYSMIVSLKPCDMCSMVINESRIDKVYYLLDRNDVSKYPDLSCNFEMVNDLKELEERYNKLLTEFFVRRR